MNKLVIKKSWFRSAGRQYGWVEDGFNILGVGIGKSYLIGNGEELVVEVDKTEYKVNCKEAVDFIKKYKSIMHPKGIVIGVVSKSLLKQV